MLLLQDRSGHVIAVQPRLRDHLAARLHADHIDHDLAQGASPDGSVAAALRAQLLTSTPTRQLLARGLQRAVNTAMTPAVASSRAAAQNRPRIREVAADLDELCRRLLANGLGEGRCAHEGHAHRRRRAAVRRASG